MGGEIIADVGEYPLHDIVETCSVVIVLGTRHWQGYEDDVIDKERSEDDERDALKILIPAEEIIESNDAYHRVIGGIAHEHQFTEKDTRHGLIEEQGRLTAEELLLPRGEDVVKVGEDAIDLIRVGIPP